MKNPCLNSLKNRPSKKLENAYILWFEESNSWAQLEEPAWYVYKNHISGKPPTEISGKFSKKYKLPLADSTTFVKDIIKELETLSNASYLPEKTFPAKEFKSPENFFSKRTYLFNGKYFEIAYGSRMLEFIMHQSFAHLEPEKPARPHYRIETFSSGSRHILKIAGKAWTEDDPNFLKRKLFIEITNLLYGKSENDWLAYIHGSAVSNGRESIVLTTECGSGKSTLAALLCHEGFKFVSDDFVPVDARFCKAYPFPAALSVKDGAYPLLAPLYNQLEKAEVFHFRGTKKTVRYLPFPDNGNFYRPLPVRKLVFVQYDVSNPFAFRKVPTLEAAKKFNDEAWLSPKPEHARKFLKWFPGVECYELVYSDNREAITKIKGLFDNP